MKKITALFFTCIIFGMTISSLEWPVSPVTLVSTFAQRMNGTIQRGIILDKTEEIRASGDGFILFLMEENKNMSGFPGTLGNCLILAHEDSLRTVYGNLENLDRASGLTEVETGTIIGNAGSSTWQAKSRCYFQVFDADRKNLLNPQMLLPSIPDTKQPVIRNVAAVSVPGGQVYSLGSIKSLKQGVYRILADIIDTVNNNTAELGAFGAGVVVNGSEIVAVPFELLKEKEGMLVTRSGMGGAELYADPARIDLGEIRFSRGRADISVIARDIAGNERSVLFGLIIE